MLGYSPTKTQKLLGNPDKSANPTASSPACAGLAGEHCIVYKIKMVSFFREGFFLKKKQKKKLAIVITRNRG